MAIPFVDSWPYGAWVQEREDGRGFDSHLGYIPMAPGQSELKFIDTYDGPWFKLAGMGQEFGYWEYQYGWGWAEVPLGSGRKVYDGAGFLRDTDPPGYQFTDDAGNPFPRLAAYMPVEGMAEWTVAGGIRFGQGMDQGGVVFALDGRLGRIDDGECYFIKARHRAGFYAISYVKKNVGAKRKLFSREELVGMLVDPVPTPVNPPSTPLPAEPSPAPGGANMIEVVRQVREKYPTPLGAEHGKFLVEVAQATGKGLLRKDWGTFINSPAGPVAQDILTDPAGAMHYDILIDGEGAAEPVWDPKGPYDPGRYVEVKLDPGPVPVPEPQPKPEPGPVPTPAPNLLLDILIELRKLNTHLGVK